MYWVFRSRFRTTTALVLIAVVTLFVCFGADFCLGRAEVNLSRRQHAVAARWIELSRWVGRQNAAKFCLLKLRLARRMEDFHEVESQLRRAGELGVPRNEVQRERWIAMAQAGQFNLMESHWNELLKDPRDDEPEIARSHYSWAIAHHDFGLALKTLYLWEQDVPTDAEPYALEGKFYQSMEDWDRAEKSYRRAFQLAPGNEEYQLSFAHVLQTRLKTREAVSIFQEYLRRHPDDLSAIRGLAQCAAANGDLATATKLLSKAIQNHPDDFETQKVYGEILLAAGDPKEALQYLKKAHEKVPEHANLAYTLARALEACGQSKEAEPLFAFVTESRPQLDQMGEMEKRLRTQPDNLELRMKIAEITARFVSRRDAIGWYENILKIAPNYIPAHVSVAELYRQLGDVKNAEYHEGFASRSRETPLTNQLVPGTHSPASSQQTISE